MPDFNEPWTIERHPTGELIGVVDCNGLVIVELTDQMYERIAACVSACADMPDPVRVVNSLKSINMVEVALKRDKLLSHARADLRNRLDNPPVGSDVWLNKIYERDTKKLEALIAECEK